MFNEEAFCRLIIERCCQIIWPRDRLLIQVLDDSTDVKVRDLVDGCAQELAEAGFPVQVCGAQGQQWLGLTSLSLDGSDVTAGCSRPHVLVARSSRTPVGCHKRIQCLLLPGV